MSPRNRELVANELCLYLAPGTTRKIRWSEPAIRAKLQPFLDGRATWPSFQEFELAGLGGLNQALSKAPGRRKVWARAYGMKPPTLPANLFPQA
jgi:hypothetical protein